MRIVSAWSAIVLVALAVLAAGGGNALANGGTQVFRVSCLPEIDLFELQDLGYVDDPSGLATGTNHDLTGKGYALYSPEWSYYRRDLPPEEADPYGTLFATRFDCKLKSDAIALIVLPVLPFQTRGGAPDIAVTLGISGHWIVEELPFRLCDDRGPITRLVYNDARKALTLEGKFGGVWAGEASPDEVLGNLRRGFGYDGAGLTAWDGPSQSEKPLPGPLTARDIDYFIHPTSKHRNTPTEDCYGLSDIGNEMMAQ
ncbi:MAG: hypothetical protein AB7P52_18925 [Alphaproteobacteria bacterium]